MYFLAYMYRSSLLIDMMGRATGFYFVALYGTNKRRNEITAKLFRFSPQFAFSFREMAASTLIFCQDLEMHGRISQLLR